MVNITSKTQKPNFIVKYKVKAYSIIILHYIQILLTDLATNQRKTQALASLSLRDH